MNETMNGKSLNITEEKRARLREVLSEAFVQPPTAAIFDVVALEPVDAATVKDILTAWPGKVISLGRLFQGNDQLKTNTALHAPQMRGRGRGRGLRWYNPRIGGAK